MAKFIIKHIARPLILCMDGEMHIDSLVGGPFGFRAKIYKTRAGAERYLARLDGTVVTRKIVALDEYGCEKSSQDFC